MGDILERGAAALVEWGVDGVMERVEQSDVEYDLPLLNDCYAALVVSAATTAQQRRAYERGVASYIIRDVDRVATLEFDNGMLAWRLEAEPNGLADVTSGSKAAFLNNAVLALLVTYGQFSHTDIVPSCVVSVDTVVDSLFDYRIGICEFVSEEIGKQIQPTLLRFAYNSAQAITNPAKYSTRGDTWPPQSLLATLCALEILERIAAWMGDGGWRVQHFGLQAALALVSLTREPPVKQRMQMASTIEEILEAVIREPIATVGDADVDDLLAWATQLSEAAVERRILEGPQEHA